MKSQINSGLSFWFVIVIGAMIFFGLYQYVWANVGVETFHARLTDGFTKVTDGTTTYIISAQKTSGEIEPFAVENNLIGLGRLDQTTVYSELKNLADSKSCVELTVHGFRFPSISYRGITKYDATAHFANQNFCD